MSLPESLFLFEIIVEELKSYINCREFCIRSQFADIFTLNLKDPNELGSFLPKRPRQIPKRRNKIRNGKWFSDRSQKASKMQTGQSILFVNSIDTLISNMKQYPMELSLWSKIIPDYKIGSTQIPWSASFIDYLNKLHRKQEPLPACVKGDYNVFDEFTSKRMAVITLNIKLSYFKDKVTSQFRSLSEENQQTFIYTGFNNKPNSVLSTIKDRPINFAEETGIIRTIYSGGKRQVRKFSRDKKKKIKKEAKFIEDSGNNKPETKLQKSLLEQFQVDNKTNHKKISNSIVTLVRSDTNLDKSKQIALIQSRSCSSINEERFSIFNYIFGGNTGPFGNQVYCVRYFMVENDFGDSPKSVRSNKSPDSPKSEGSTKSAEYLVNAEGSDKSENTDHPNEMKLKERYKFRVCEIDCPGRKADTGSNQSVCSLDLPKDASPFITVKKCGNIDCDYRKLREVPTPPNDQILLELSALQNNCCDVAGKVEEVVGGMTAKMKFGDNPCYCECECKFDFMKKTTYCNICGGYEVVGDEYVKRPGYDMTFPCPIFHKLAEKAKMKTLSTSGSDFRRKENSKQKFTAAAAAATVVTDKSAESEKEEKKKEDRITTSTKTTTLTKKAKKKRKDDRFKFNYGYTAPHIGHSRCAMPCSGTLGVVPKGMGWLWTAEDVPGIKHRPLWKPGAANKHVVRLLKMAKNPGEVLAKKRKKDLGKVKRPLKRPLLIVHKKDDEYTVTMETMKTYTKPRTFNQYPYEDKPVVTYTIGRTEEENRERKKKKERARRRLERLQREFIQSAFRDMCEEICVKTYQQALGILPDAEHPDCPCYPAEPGPDRTDLDHSCSCSEDKSLTESDTDSDEWIVEFTPPNATFDPTYKGKRVTCADISTQYTYMDYRVKLLDRYGNPVPRYFKGPDGKQQCSDLGGFWDPNHKWLEINADGYIGPDERWAPNNFLGPNGEHVEAESGKFQAVNGKWLVVGVDGYIDGQGNWKFYPKPKPVPEGKPRRSVVGKKAIKEEPAGMKPSEATWSCFGSVSPKQLSKMGIIGHGHDKKLLLSTLQDLQAQGEDVKIPEPATIPRSGKKGKGKQRISGIYEYDRRKCKHAMPSDKGIVAVDGHGHKTYFRLKDFDNRRPKQRIAALTDQGISLSSFHMPCFHSFISKEIMKKQQYERLLALSKGANANHKCTTTSTHECGISSGSAK